MALKLNLTGVDRSLRCGRPWREREGMGLPRKDGEEIRVLAMVWCGVVWEREFQPLTRVRVREKGGGKVLSVSVL